MGRLMLFLDRGEHFACAFPSRSYVVTARVEHALPHASLFDALPPPPPSARSSSIRSVPYRGEELLMVLGEDHLAGMLTADAIADRNNAWASHPAQRA